jgi:hypothetical protein
MKSIKHILSAITVTGLLFGVGSCTQDLLEQDPTTELATDAFWKTEDDATFALNGAYASVRPLFDRDYYLDGHGEYVRTRGTSATSGNLRLGDAYHDGDYNPSGYGDNFDKMYRYLYGGVNRTNYVITNVERMLRTAKPESIPKLEAIVGEAKLLRGMVYFRLISMWGDVPYFTKIAESNADVSTLARTPMTQVKKKGRVRGVRENLLHLRSVGNCNFTGRAGTVSAGLNLKISSPMQTLQQQPTMPQPQILTR